MSSTQEKTWTLQELLAWSRDYFQKNDVDSPRLTAELLLAHLLEVPRIRLYTDLTRPMEKDELARYRELVLRRVRGEPTQYLLGSQEFYGRTFKSDARALIPRPETELVVERVLRHLSRERPALVVDVGCGSGAIGLTVAAERPLAQVVLLDVSRDALSLTQENAQQLEVDDRAFLAVGDLLEPLKLPELRSFAAQHRENWASALAEEERNASEAMPVKSSSMEEGEGKPEPEVSLRAGDKFTQEALVSVGGSDFEAAAESSALPSSGGAIDETEAAYGEDPDLYSGDPDGSAALQAEFAAAGDPREAAVLKAYSGFVPQEGSELIAEVIVANLPYVPEGELSSLAPHIREHEPQLALIAGEDGLELIRRLIPTAVTHLLPGGLLVLEHAEDQGEAIAGLFDSEFWEPAVTERDLAGLDRFTWAVRRGACDLCAG